MYMKKIAIIVIVIAMLFAANACQSSTPQTADSSDASGAPSPDVEDPTPAPTDEPAPDGIKHTNILLLGASSKDFSEEDSTYALTHILVTLDPVERTM